MVIRFIHVDEKESRLIFNSTIYVMVEIYVLYILRKHWATIHGRGKHLVFLSVIRARSRTFFKQGMRI